MLTFTRKLRRRILAWRGRTFGGPIAGPTYDPAWLEAAPGVMVPCPDDRPGNCDSADLLKSADTAAAVYVHLRHISEKSRTADQENNLGKALAWRGDWTGARDAFERSEAKAKGSARARAIRNRRIAEDAAR
jgi:hypothetical protein